MAVTEHLPIEDFPQFLVTTDRQRKGEDACEGCRKTFGVKWPFGIILALVTDRSGSVQAISHNDPECIRLTCERLEDGDI